MTIRAPRLRDLDFALLAGMALMWPIWLSVPVAFALGMIRVREEDLGNV